MHSAPRACTVWILSQMALFIVSMGMSNGQPLVEQRFFCFVIFQRPPHPFVKWLHKGGEGIIHWMLPQFATLSECLFFKLCM